MAKPEKNIQSQTQHSTHTEDELNAAVAVTSAEDASAEAAPEAVSDAPKRSRKLTKEIKYEDGGAVIIAVVNGEKGAMTFNFSDLPEDIQQRFGPFGLGHKLGDAPAGESGIEAEKAIQTVWDGLVKGNWSVRAPAAPKIDKKAVTARFQNMDDAKRLEALETLKTMGIDPASLGLV